MPTDVCEISPGLLEYHFCYERFNFYCLKVESDKQVCNPILILSGAFQSMS